MFRLYDHEDFNGFIRQEMTKIYFVRHAQAEGGTYPHLDPELTKYGIKQASNLEGHYDLVILSPMKRCQETLEYSKITYKKKITSPLLREWIRDFLPTRLHEKEKPETIEQFKMRIDNWKKELSTLQAENILIIGHSLFYNSWQGKEPSYEIGEGNMAQIV